LANPINLSSLETNPDEVLDILKSLKTNKATGPDCTGAKMLKEAGPSIAQSLCNLINMSLRKCIFPAMWKQANVIPIHKKNERHLVNNFRPISLLSCAGKIMEKVVFKHVFNYIRDNNLITEFQSSFIPGDSTVHQLVQLCHIFGEALDNKKDVRIVVCDISKAFDRVWHDGLLFKMKKMGIDGDLGIWFDSYLKNSAS
jgi:hypothetical protein